MTTSVVSGSDEKSIIAQINNSYKADAIEVRFDLIDKFEIDEIKSFLDLFDKKVIFTFKKNNFYFDKLFDFLKLNPTFIDLEYDTDKKIIDKINQNYPNIKIILSYHNFKKTPNLDLILSKIQKKRASFYKIACKANNINDAFKMLFFLKKNNKDNNIIGISISKEYSFQRLISKIFNSPITYCYIEKQTALGQFLLDDFLGIYDFKKVNQNTKIFALLANPINKSISHIYHNKRFQKENKNAIYVKIFLKENELQYFFENIKNFPFKGLSISMPFKEEALKFIDEDLSKVNSINTIDIKDNKLIGYNTDAIACISLIEKRIDLEKKTVVILGSGGTAKAIANFIKTKKVNLIILNRTKSKAKEIANSLNCKYGSLEDIKFYQDYDIIINATSCSMKNIMPINKKYLISNKIAFDVVYNPKDTIFLQEAKKNTMKIINEHEFFKKQTSLQFN